MSPEEIHSPIYKSPDLAYVVQSDDGLYLLMAVQNEVKVSIPLSEKKLWQLLEQITVALRRTHASEPQAAHYSNNSERQVKSGNICDRRV
jgi:hypothetical protein